LPPTQKSLRIFKMNYSICLNNIQVKFQSATYTLHYAIFI
jgi:hypothetical protein